MEYLKLYGICPRAETFVSEEEGAVSVDWVVLTAGIVGVAALSADTIINATTTLATSVSSAVSTKTISNGD